MKDLASLAPGRPRGRPRGLWRCLAVGDAAARVREISFAVPAPKRPPGRPFGAYAVSCVVPMTLRVWRRAIRVLTQISRIRTPPSAMGAGVPQHMDKTSSNECLAPIRRWLSSSSPRGEVSATGRQAAQPIVNSTPTPDGRRARENLQKQAARHRAPPITTPPPVDGVISTPPAAFAKANTPSTTKHPYADCCRPRGCNRRPRRFHSLTTALVAQQTKNLVARRRGRRGCEQPRCARGNLKGRPKAWTKMTKGGPA
ncbi:hypothetical protein D3C85_670370 [compost metagenome]